MFEVVYSHIRSIDIVNENYLTNNYEPNKIIFSFNSYSLHINAIRRRQQDLYQTASSNKDVKKGKHTHISLWINQKYYTTSPSPSSL